MDAGIRHKVAVAVMARDEETRLEPWLIYHGHLFGFENLYVLDNGSASEIVHDILIKYASRGVNVNYNYNKPEDFLAKGEIIANLFLEIERKNHHLFYFPIDCDEFLAVRLPDGSLTANRDVISSQLELLKGDPHILVVRDAYANILNKPGYFFPPYEHHKVFFTEGCCLWMQEGFHVAKSRRLQEERVTDFVYLHFHYRPFEDMVKQSANKLEKYVNINDSARLAKYKGNAFHVVQYLLMSEREYLDRFDRAQGIHVPWLIPYLKMVGVNQGFLSSI
jgi:hypothetical protein